MSWLSRTDANNLKQSYILGFLDISGDLIVRNNGLTVLADSSFNSNVRMTQSLFVNNDLSASRIFVNTPQNVNASAKMAINGSTEFYGNINIATNQQNSIQFGSVGQSSATSKISDTGNGNPLILASASSVSINAMSNLNDNGDFKITQSHIEIRKPIAGMGTDLNASSFHPLIILNDLSINNGLVVSNDIYGHSSLNLDGSATLQGNLFVANVAEFANAIKLPQMQQEIHSVLIKKDSIVDASLQINGSMGLSGKLGVAGNMDLCGNMGVGGRIDVCGNMVVDGNMDLSGNMGVGGRIDVCGNMVADGNMDLSGNMSVGGNIDISGNMGLGGNMGVRGKLDVSGNVVVDGNMDLSGNMNVRGKLDVSDNMKVGGKVDVSSNMGVGGKVDVSGNMGVGGNMDVSGNIGVGGNMDIRGNVFFNNTLVSRIDTSLNSTKLYGSTFAYGNTYIAPSSSNLSSNQLSSSNIFTVVGNTSLNGNLFLNAENTITGQNMNLLLNGNLNIAKDVNLQTTPKITLNELVLDNLAIEQAKYVKIGNNVNAASSVPYINIYNTGIDLSNGANIIMNSGNLAINGNTSSVSLKPHDFNISTSKYVNMNNEGIDISGGNVDLTNGKMNLNASSVRIALSKFDNPSTHSIIELQNNKLNVNRGSIELNGGSSLLIPANGNIKMTNKSNIDMSDGTLTMFNGSITLNNNPIALYPLPFVAGTSKFVSMDNSKIDMYNGAQLNVVNNSKIWMRNSSKIDFYNDSSIVNNNPTNYITINDDMIEVVGAYEGSTKEHGNSKYVIMKPAGFNKNTSKYVVVNNEGINLYNDSSINIYNGGLIRVEGKNDASRYISMGNNLDLSGSGVEMKNGYINMIPTYDETSLTTGITHQTYINSNGITLTKGNLYINTGGNFELGGGGLLHVNYAAFKLTHGNFNIDAGNFDMKTAGHFKLTANIDVSFSAFNITDSTTVIKSSSHNKYIEMEADYLRVVGGGNKLEVVNEGELNLRNNSYMKSYMDGEENTKYVNIKGGEFDMSGGNLNLKNSSLNIYDKNIALVNGAIDLKPAGFNNATSSYMYMSHGGIDVYKGSIRLFESTLTNNGRTTFTGDMYLDNRVFYAINGSSFTIAATDNPNRETDGYTYLGAGSRVFSGGTTTLKNSHILDMSTCNVYTHNTGIYLRNGSFIEFQEQPGRITLNSGSSLTLNSGSNLNMTAVNGSINNSTLNIHNGSKVTMENCKIDIKYKGHDSVTQNNFEIGGYNVDFKNDSTTDENTKYVRLTNGYYLMVRHGTKDNYSAMHYDHIVLYKASLNVYESKIYMQEIIGLNPNGTNIYRISISIGHSDIIVANSAKINLIDTAIMELKNSAAINVESGGINIKSNLSHLSLYRANGLFLDTTSTYLNNAIHYIYNTSYILATNSSSHIDIYYAITHDIQHTQFHAGGLSLRKSSIDISGGSITVYEKINGLTPKYTYIDKDGITLEKATMKINSGDLKMDGGIINMYGSFIYNTTGLVSNDYELKFYYKHRSDGANTGVKFIGGSTEDSTGALVGGVEHFRIAAGAGTSNVSGIPFIVEDMTNSSKSSLTVKRYVGDKGITPGNVLFHGKLVVNNHSYDINGFDTSAYALNVSGKVNAESYNATSDKRLKTNIAIMNSQLENIKKIMPVSFQWTDTSKNDIGFIAQDIYQTYPVLYPENKSVDGEIDLTPVDQSGNPIYLTIDYGKLTCILWKGLHETLTIVDVQKEQIGEQKEQICQLQSRVTKIEVYLSRLLAFFFILNAIAVCYIYLHM
jgi:cytoskeletal protein CcmA (bactofilin family)